MKLNFITEKFENFHGQVNKPKHTEKTDKSPKIKAIKIKKKTQQSRCCVYTRGDKAQYAEP